VSTCGTWAQWIRQSIPHSRVNRNLLERAGTLRAGLRLFSISLVSEKNSARKLAGQTKITRIRSNGIKLGKPIVLDNHLCIGWLSPESKISVAVGLRGPPYTDSAKPEGTMGGV
jgi:hypothetical protein